ncbi:MAG: hypothetical protein JWP57_4058 [Spirosoma sp.]|nr:hypothetical protein [Spirosoma sp.]
MFYEYHKQQQALRKKHSEEKESLSNFQQQLRVLVAKRHKAEERVFRFSSESKALRMGHQREWAELTQSELLSRELLDQQQQQELTNLREKYRQLKKQSEYSAV